MYLRIDKEKKEMNSITYEFKYKQSHGTNWTADFELKEGPEDTYSVCPVWKTNFGDICLKPKFDDDADDACEGSSKRTRKTKFGPTFYVFYRYWNLRQNCEKFSIFTLNSSFYVQNILLPKDFKMHAFSW